MNGVGWLCLYTPLPWLVAMYAVAYRYDLGRLVKPLHDSCSPSLWWEVCRNLGLIDAGFTKPEEGPRQAGPYLLAVASVAISTLWSFLPFPLPWYYLCAIQAAAAVPLFVVVLRWAGPLPFRPYRDVLPYPRLGTRVRHLAKRSKPAVSTTGETA